MVILAKVLFAVALICAAAGLVLLLLHRWIGAERLPGDIVLERGSMTFIFPLATCLLLSVVGSAALFLINLFRS